MRNETLIAPVGPAASSSAWATVSPTSRLSSSDSGDWARQRRTKSRMSGIEDGRAGKVCDTTTTGTTSMFSLIASSSALSMLQLRRSGAVALPDAGPLAEASFMRVCGNEGGRRISAQADMQVRRGPPQVDMSVYRGDFSVLWTAE